LVSIVGLLHFHGTTNGCYTGQWKSSAVR
jgi:hypothetical protein